MKMINFSITVRKQLTTQAPERAGLQLWYCWSETEVPGA